VALMPYWMVLVKPPRTKHELRCLCRPRPLLAIYGLDSKGRTFVHVKVYKQSHIYGEVVVYGGEITLRCRECYRWNNIIFVTRSKDRAVLQETVPPPELDNPDILSAATVEG
jgi:hypothetical protein